MGRHPPRPKEWPLALRPGARLRGRREWKGEPRLAGLSPESADALRAVRWRAASRLLQLVPQTALANYQSLRGGGAACRRISVILSGTSLTENEQ